jgi:4-diphosphocytidyl-2-C-methyl-D-erythritol kinase
MLVFPPAKINLGLHVLRQRTDGYRDIETVMVRIPLYDALEAIIDPDVADGGFVFTRSGLEVPGDPTQDLCAKAHGLLKAQRSLPGLRVHLHKAIPIGAGLGGGSSDGAHALDLINRLLGLGIGQTDLLAMAARLGSDCPFFLGHGAQLASGRGEELVPLDLSLRGLWLMLVDPGIHIGTAEVYANTGTAPAKADLVELIMRSPPEEWSGRLVNVMEDYVLKAYPMVAEAKRLISEAGATYSAMSGSGSSVFGLFRERPALPVLPSGYRGRVLPL